MLSIPLGNSCDFNNIDPEAEGFNSEQNRTIVAGEFNGAALENTIVLLQDDPTVYEFFARKKGKKYKIKNGQCTLGQLKSFSYYLQEDIEAITVEIEALVVKKEHLATKRSKGTAVARAQFIEGVITENDLDKIRSVYVSKEKEAEELLNSHSNRSLKLKDVRTHVNSLILKNKA